jgi:fatty acid desaturase
MPKLLDKQLLLDLHKPGWDGFWLSQLYAAFYFALVFGIGRALEDDRTALLVPLVAAQAFIMHAYLIAFHEAAHGTLCPVGFINGYLGRVTGVLSFMSLTLYRAAHHWHHAYIGDRRDEEFWPLNDPAAPRWKRRLAAFLELTCAMLWSPFLFLRMFLRRGSAIRGRAVRRLIWIELAGMAAFWVAVAGAAAWFDALPLLVVGYLLPAYIAGNVQSLRKYVEHVGLTGPRSVYLTRSVRNPSRLGRFVSRLLFNEPYHDVHHLYPKVPQEALPTVAAAENPVPAELPVFSNYPAALIDLVRTLGDPKFGKSWAEEVEPVSDDVPQAVHALRDPA